MFIPPPSYISKLKEKEQLKGMLQLNSSHLHISHEIAEKIFPGEKSVFMVYYPKKQSLMIAPISDELFKNLHKAGQHMLKDRNLKGDKTIALHEILIDNQLDETDRELEYELVPGLGILNVKL